MVYFQSEQDIFAFEAGESDDQSISTSVELSGLGSLNLVRF